MIDYLGEGLGLPHVGHQLTWMVLWGAVRCAVITPYKSQKFCIVDELKYVLGARDAEGIRVDTVDSFQVARFPSLLV